MLTRDQVIATLQTVKDPEVHLDVYTMGLIYNIEIENNDVKILMTYTTPFCPWGPDLNEAVKNSLEGVGADKVDITITFDPPYKMPEDLRAMLGV